MSEKFKTKIELFKFDQKDQVQDCQSFEIEESPKKEETLLEQENRKAYTSMLQN